MELKDSDFRQAVRPVPVSHSAPTQPNSENTHPNSEVGQPNPPDQLAALVVNSWEQPEPDELRNLGTDAAVAPDGGVVSGAAADASAAHTHGASSIATSPFGVRARPVSAYFEVVPPAQFPQHEHPNPRAQPRVEALFAQQSGELENFSPVAVRLEPQRPSPFNPGSFHDSYLDALAQTAGSRRTPKHPEK